MKCNSKLKKLDLYHYKILDEFSQLNEDFLNSDFQANKRKNYLEMLHITHSNKLKLISKKMKFCKNFFFFKYLLKNTRYI